MICHSNFNSALFYLLVLNNGTYKNCFFGLTLGAMSGGSPGSPSQCSGLGGIGGGHSDLNNPGIK